MKVVVCVAVMCLGMWRGSDAYGAGRALPIKAENFVIKRFTRINPSLKWDPSNFLTDLAGIFANCKWIGTRGFKTVKRNTPEGGAIVAIVDYTSGSEPDAPSVTKYVRRVFKKWTKKSTYVAQIRKADLFGCAVRPACKGRVSVSCLFTSRRNFSTTTMPAPPTTSTQPPNPLTMTHRLETTTVLTPRVPEPPQRALAFTKEQYDLAENLTKTSWDRSHFLENLSGYETHCAMNGRKSWPFANARRIATEMGHKIVGLHKDAPNRGSTTDALRVIFQSFKALPYAKEIGCSVIPDCTRPRRGGTTEMYVVVSCVYEKK